MPFVNNHLAPWFGAFAWLAFSTFAGLGYSKKHGITGIRVFQPIAVVAAVLFVGFIVLCAVAVPSFGKYGRSERDARKGRGGRGAG